MLVNGWIVGSDWARAVGRFKPEGPDGYRAATMPSAPLRKTRTEAVADELRYRMSRNEVAPARRPLRVRD